MEPQNILSIALIALFCSGAFLGGMYYAGLKEVNCRELIDSSQEEGKEKGCQPATLLHPPITNITPPTWNISPPHAAQFPGGNASSLPPTTVPANLPVMGTIEAVSGNVITLAIMPPPPNQTQKLILIGEETKILLTKESTNQAEIEEFNKNLLLIFPENVPKPKLYVQVPGTISDLRQGMTITAFGEGNIQAAEEFTAAQIIAPPTG